MTFRRLALTGLAWTAALLMALPIVLMALTAFKTDAAADLGPLAPFTPTLGNFASQNSNVAMVRPVLNSVVEAIGGTALCLLFALPAAYGLAFHAGRSRTAVLLGMLTTRFMPGVGILIPMYLIFKAVGLIDTQLGLVLIYAVINLPIAVWMLYSYMRDLPRDILDSGRLDGASVRQQIVFLLVPLCAPGIASTALLSVVLCWNEAFWSLQMTSRRSSQRLHREPVRRPIAGGNLRHVTDRGYADPRDRLGGSTPFCARLDLRCRALTPARHGPRRSPLPRTRYSTTTLVPIPTRP